MQQLWDWWCNHCITVVFVSFPQLYVLTRGLADLLAAQTLEERKKGMLGFIYAIVFSIVLTIGFFWLGKPIIIFIGALWLALIARGIMILTMGIYHKLFYANLRRVAHGKGFDYEGARAAGYTDEEIAKEVENL